MAYSVPLVAQNIFILKHKLHCTRCENKLKRLLSNVQGIQTVNIDSKKGTITVVGTVDPATIVTLLGNLGRKAEVLWQQILIPSSKKDDHDNNNNNNNNNQNLQLVTKSKKVVLDDHDMVALLKQLSGGTINKGSKTIEVSCSKIIRLIVNGGDDDQNPGENKNMEITIRDGVLHGPKISDSEGGGLCSASASCCGCHGHGGINNRNSHGNSSCCCCQIHASYGYGFVPTGTPPPWPGSYYGSTPSAPPLGLPYDNQYQPPSTSYPVMGYSSSSFLSDDNPAGGCSII